MATSKKTAASKTPAPRTPPINFGEADAGPGPLPVPTNIDEAIVAIMEQVGYVRKQKGEQLNYAYAGEAALIAAIRPWMVHFGVYMRVVDVRDANEQDRPRDRGGNTRLASITSVVRFTHAPSRTYIDCTARGEGADVSDKANNKAQTGAYKYALRQTFCIETGLDPDSHSPLVPSQARAASPAHPRPTADWDNDEPPPPDESEAPPEVEMDQTPAPPPPAKKDPPFAEVHISAQVRRNYDTWVAKLIKRYPAYSLQKQGQPTDLPDNNHIRATAKSLGYAEITDATYQTVLEAIAKHAAEKAGSGEKAPAKTATKQTSGGAAKRPTNDEALKRAGF